jgi:GntR family transcriptional regulator, transcriptional repressor for pyruvate dehydrogenase complex
MMDLTAVPPITRQDLHLEVTTRLARLVVASAPGTRLPTERELCERFGVGRSSVREALRSLAFVGAVEQRQGSGTFVSTLPSGAVDRLIGLGLMVQRSKVHEVVESRRALEIETARLAAIRHNETERVQLAEVMSAMRSAEQDPVQLRQLDLRYHVLLARASHNSVLLHFVNGMRSLLGIWIGRAVSDSEVMSQIVVEHEEILEAVFRRDSEQAAHLMDVHLTKGAARLLAVIGREQTAADYIVALLEQPSPDALFLDDPGDRNTK